MSKYFYAYHGPKNVENFDFSSGYGVSREAKQKQTEIGDFVYVIQKLKHTEIVNLVVA
jgi:5-methylcytosine-specific restriction protein A